MLILRVEIPELGLRKTMKVDPREPLSHLLHQLRKKANLDDQFLRQARFYRPATNEWINGALSLTCQLGEWCDNDVIQLLRVTSKPVMQRKEYQEVLMSRNISGERQPLVGKQMAAMVTQNSGLQSSTSAWAQCKTFGVALCDVPMFDGVPVIVRLLLQHLRRNDMQTEGLFRLSGAQSTIQRLKHAFEDAPDGLAHLVHVQYDPLRDLVQLGDGHAVAGVVKLFLRELATPLLTYGLFDAFVASQSVQDVQRKLMLLYALVHCMPVEHQALLNYLLLFFVDLVQNQQDNKMTIQNVATVFGPNVMRTTDEGSPHTMVQNASVINSITLELLKNFDVMQMSQAEAMYHCKVELGRQIVAVARAQFAFQAPAHSTHQLSFGAGAYFLIFTDTHGGDLNFDEDEWWYADSMTAGGQCGMVPSNFMQVVARWVEWPQKMQENTVLHAPATITLAGAPKPKLSQSLHEDSFATEVVQHRVDTEQQTEMSHRYIGALQAENKHLLRQLAEMQARLSALDMPRSHSPVPYLDICRGSSFSSQRTTPPRSPLPRSPAQHSCVVLHNQHEQDELVFGIPIYNTLRQSCVHQDTSIRISTMSSRRPPPPPPPVQSHRDRFDSAELEAHLRRRLVSIRGETLPQVLEASQQQQSHVQSFPPPAPPCDSVGPPHDLMRSERATSMEVLLSSPIDPPPPLVMRSL